MIAWSGRERLAEEGRLLAKSMLVLGGEDEEGEEELTLDRSSSSVSEPEP